MELDTADLGSIKLALYPDVVYMVAIDLPKSTTHAATDASLLTVVDIVVADDVRTDVVAVPSFSKGVHCHLDVLCGAVEMSLCP